jgi:hypothetical protein
VEQVGAANSCSSSPNHAIFSVNLKTWLSAVGENVRDVWNSFLRKAALIINRKL